jgi:plastocyanin
MHRRWTRALAVVSLLSLFLAACGGDETDADQDGASPTETETASPTETEDDAGADLTIADFHFSPADLTVSDGDTITIFNIGSTSHTFTTEDREIDVTVGTGEEVEVPIEGVSSQGFECRFHSQMQGTLTVE